jgi:hypothetical protein
MTRVRVARRTVCGLLLGAVLISGCGSLRAAPDAAYDRAVSYFDRWAEAREPKPVEVADGLRDYTPADQTTAVAKPVRVEIPSVGIASNLERLGLASDGAIQTPEDWDSAGWYRGGPRPGQHGAAVILGHVDSTTGPAVFYRLRQLQAGDRITVDRADGTAAVFEVERVEQHGKTRFPTDDVYYPTPEPTLRLVTCGGDFDTAARSYTDNVVVFARLAADAM